MTRAFLFAGAVLLGACSRGPLPARQDPRCLGVVCQAWAVCVGSDSSPGGAICACRPGAGATHACGQGELGCGEADPWTAADDEAYCAEFGHVRSPDYPYCPVAQ